MDEFLRGLLVVAGAVAVVLISFAISDWNTRRASRRAVAAEVEKAIEAELADLDAAYERLVRDYAGGAQ